MNFITHFHMKVEHSAALSAEHVYIPIAIPSDECSIHHRVFCKANENTTHSYLQTLSRRLVDIL